MDERDTGQIGTSVDAGGSPPLEALLADIESEAAGSEHLGSGPAPAVRDDAGAQYIRFVMDGVHFAVPLESALEVGRLPGITPLPNLPAWVSGISNIRGEVVSIVDLKHFFGRGGSTGGAGANMVLLQSSHLKVGFRVDRLMGIVTLAGSDAKVTANPFTKGDITPYLSGVVATGESLLYLLDVEALLTSEKMNGFQRP